MITIEDYNKAINVYRDFMLDHNAYTVLQCGTIKNPGVSDIDCIVVLNSWNDFSNDIRFFNPEFFSELFTHGPFVITKDQLQNLYRFTTLRPESSEKISIIEHPLETRRVTIAVRQSWSWSHLWLTLEQGKNQDSRSLLLLAKSIFYTVREIFELSDNKTSFLKLEKDFDYLINNFRHKFVNDGYINKNDIGELQQACKKNLIISGEVICTWILSETKIKTSDFKKVILDFSSQTRSLNTLKIFHNEKTTSEWDNMRFFLKDVINGYDHNQLLIRGAEFPFHMIASDLLGWKIWPRRFIKKGLIPLYKRLYKLN